MLFHKILKSRVVARNLARKEIDKNVQKYFLYLPYRQLLRVSLPRGVTRKELLKMERQYRILRMTHIRRLKSLNTYDSCLARWNGRCNYTGKFTVHDKFLRISTVPLRHMLKDNMVPGYQRAIW